MSGHPLFDAAGADLLQKDLMQRRLHHLESLNANTRIYQSTQEILCISVGGELDLEKAVRIIDALDQRLIVEDSANSAFHPPGHRQRDASVAMFLFDADDSSIQDFLAARDDAN